MLRQPGWTGADSRDRRVNPRLAPFTNGVRLSLHRAPVSCSLGRLGVDARDGFHVTAGGPFKGVAAVVALLCSLVPTLAACGSDDEPAVTPTSGTATEPSGASSALASTKLAGVKEFLGDHTDRLAGFTVEFRERSTRYYELAEAREFDLRALWAEEDKKVGPLLNELKALWVEGNPYYERVEGIVAGTPSLAEYDVIVDAGSSAEEDPESAVPFDLELPDGTVLEQPGNLFNLTEGALWGTLPNHLGRAGAPADLDGDGRLEFGEVLPDPGLLYAAAESFEMYANELDAAGETWQPTPSDAFTAIVVMVPTMSEYFGQWKVSRFVAGEAASSEAFNVVSRLSDIRDILTGLEVIYGGVQPAVAEIDGDQAAQTGRELSDLREFIGDLYERERAGNKFTPEQADALGSEAQERATAIAGQVSQAAARLGVEIEQ
jgi:Imelysin